MVWHLRQPNRGMPTGPRIFGRASLRDSTRAWVSSLKWPCAVFCLGGRSVKYHHCVHNSIFIGFYRLCCNINTLGLVGRVFANGPGNRGSIPGRVMTKTIKLFLMPPYLTFNIIRYGSMVKWSNPGKEMHPLLHLGVVANEKGDILSSQQQSQTLPSLSLSLYIYIYIYIYICISVKYFVKFEIFELIQISCVLCLMTYQTSWIISTQSNPDRILVVLFNL